MRNTAPCIGYVAWKVFQRHPNSTLVVSPADHIVLDGDAFRRVINQGIEFVSNSGRVLTSDMQPSFPNTG